MLVATAGHIDHGKTALIRALTGVETDRLPEEKARGISIDLGFAYWQPDPGKTIGFVDVPGHERFIRNMLAGVGAIDFALLVVAADDGVMPQTVEHVQILDLLDIRRGLVAITKCDRGDRQRIDAVRRQVADLLGPTSLAASPIFEVSSVTGAGLAEIGAALRAANQELAPRTWDGRGFRLAIDRVFSLSGVGTVVTGTVLDGALEAGARLVVSPRGVEARVRGLQSGGHAVERVQAGERCAVNLAGVEVAEVRRGDVLSTAALHAPTSRIEADLRVLPGRGDALKHHTPVHLHLGTADIAARVLIPGQVAIPPGGHAVVQLVLTQPTAAVNGDRFVLRDQSGRHSIAGGRVIDPFVTGDRRDQAGRALISAALRRPAPEALAALLEIPGQEVDTHRFEQTFNLEAAAAAALYRRSAAVLLGTVNPLALPARRVEAVAAEVPDILASFHRDHPDAAGMTRRDLKAAISQPISTRAFLILQKELSEKRVIESTGSLVKLAGHAAGFSPAENALWQRVFPRLLDRGIQPFGPRDLAADLRVSEASLKNMLYRRREAGEVWLINGDRFLLRQQVAALAATAAALARETGDKGLAAGQYRDAIGTGRGLAIHLLEFFDRIGVTHRNGDARKMRPDYELVVGSASPYVPAKTAGAVIAKTKPAPGGP